MNLSELIIIGVAAMCIMAVGIILFVVKYQRDIIKHNEEIKKINAQKQLEIQQAAIQSEEEERNRIAAELHDDVGVTLSSIRLFLSREMQSEADNRIAQQSKMLLDECIQKIRDISHKLQPAVLHRLGLQASVFSLADVINNSGAIQTKVCIGQDLPRLPDAVELSLYRIIQEVLNNTIKHSASSFITIHLSLPATGLQILVEHDGRGLTNETYQELIYKKGTVGLKSIVNRLQSINAHINFEKINDNLYQVSINTLLNNTTK